MALDPQYLDSLPQSLVDMYAVVEIDILQDMARRISTYNYFIPAALHQNQKLQELGLTQQYIIEALAGMTGQTQQEIVDLLTEASEVAIEDDVEYYTRADVYEPSKVNTEALHKQLNSGLIQTQQAFKNITRTTANSGGIQFIEALDRAWTQINVGGIDYNTAIQNAVKDLAKKGLNATNSKGEITKKGAIKYSKTGHVDTLEVAVRRAVVTGVNQTASKIQETLADELGVELVEVTAHGGARPDHAKWQGKVFSRHGDVEIDGVKYKDLAKATGYGSGAGLCGWNCRHNFHPYIPGAPRTWSDKQLKDLDKKNIEYNGTKYSEYEASQIQRGIERDIRSLKRQIAAIEEIGGDASAERSKLKKANKAYTDFTEQTGLKKQTARTKVATGDGKTDPKKNNHVNIAKDTQTKQNVTSPVQTKQKSQDAEENKGLTNNVNNDTIKKNEFKNDLKPRAQVTEKIQEENLYNWVANDIGVDEERATEYTDAVMQFTDAGSEIYSEIRRYQRAEKLQFMSENDVKKLSDDIEEYIKRAPRWNGGETFRGVSMSDEELASREPGGDVTMGGTASWSGAKHVSRDFAERNTSSERPNPVIYHCPTQSKGTGIKHLSVYEHEEEILCSKESKYKIVKIERDNDFITHIYLEEGDDS